VNRQSGRRAETQQPEQALALDAQTNRPCGFARTSRAGQRAADVLRAFELVVHPALTALNAACA
jgi:hypothetical protein